MRESRNFLATRAGRLCVAMLVALVVPVMLSACGPAFRFRPAGLLAAGDVEVGGGLGAGVLLDNGTPGGAEGQVFVRWTPQKAPRLELAHRFFTHSFISMGWSPEFRIQPVKGPFDLTIDFGGVFGLCWTLACGQETTEHPIGAAIGFDVGLSVGKRFGGDKAAAIYFSPHFQMAWTVVDPNWPGKRLLYFPVGMDIPLGTPHISLRPEILLALQIRGSDLAPLKRLAGGIAIAFNGPGPKKLRRMKKDKAAAKKAAEENPPALSRPDKP